MIGKAAVGIAVQSLDRKAHFFSTDTQVWPPVPLPPSTTILNRRGPRRMPSATSAIYGVRMSTSAALPPGTGAGRGPAW